MLVHIYQKVDKVFIIIIIIIINIINIINIIIIIIVFENLVGFKALTIVLSYRNHIVMEVQYLVMLLLIHLLIFGQIRRYNATICQYCGKDFKSLGKHVWRCKSRVGNLSHDGQVSQGHAAECKFKFSGNRL